MKKINIHFSSFLLTGLLLGAVFTPGGHAAAQANTAAATSESTVKGRVIDDKGAPVPYATIGLKGTSAGAASDENGMFTIALPAGTNSGIVVISSIGYLTREMAFDGSKDLAVTLVSSAKNLNEVVVIGYGTAKSKDLTGAVATVSEKDFNTGTIATADQLIQGKVAGVVVTSNGGAPGGGASINIRGQNSINLTTQPLIVLDGMPMDRKGINGAPDILSSINPDDIETFTVLKDAASCAIYGDRGSNGVILITTKHGRSGKLRVDFNSVTSVSQITKYVDVMGADAFRAYIKANGTASDIALLGTANTDWQKQIFQNAVSTDNTISLSGGIKNLPYRISFSNFGQDGILKTGYLKRQSVSLNLSPTFLKNSLKVTANVNATHSESRFANTGAIGDAIRFDPTKPVYSGTSAYDGYYTWLNQSSSATPKAPISLATSNPVADLNEVRDISGVNRGIGNLQLEYALPSFPELRAVVNGGADISRSNGYKTVLPTFAGSYAAGGTYAPYTQSINNTLLDAYLNYKKTFESAKSAIDVTAGYGYQDFQRYAPGTSTYYTPSASGVITPTATTSPDSTEAVLLSYYARLNYTFHDKYLLSLSDREDYSSRIAGNHGANFASVAVAWKINEENFLKNVRAISQLKLRAGFGQTGNAEIDDYAYIPNYYLAQGTAQYQLGNENHYLYAPLAYNTNLKWETVNGSNIALDYGFLNNRISGSIDFYQKKSSNLLLKNAPIPALANLSNVITENIGELTNKGMEFSISAIPIQTKNLNWTVNYNIGYNKNEITALYGDATVIATGGISGGTGNMIQAQVVGHSVNAFYAYQQVYSQTGVPIEGLYVTQSNGGNLYSYKKPDPTVTMGFSTTLNYKKWGLFIAGHGSFGNYLYNNNLSNLGSKLAFTNSLNFIANGSPDANYTNFKNATYFSDYYIQNASFVRIDNISLSYDFGKVIAHKVGIKVSAICQNVFVITKYTGLDPEIGSGIDNNAYPRPRIYSLGVHLNY